jgi:Integrase core domain
LTEICIISGHRAIVHWILYGVKCICRFSYRLNESFFSRLKVEWADEFYEARTFEELKEMVQRAIAYYNEDRYHSSLGYRTPLAFLKGFLTSHPQPTQAVS